MKRLDAWVGEWAGSGTASMGPSQRQDFRISEKVQPRIGGAILLVEGLGTTKNESTGAESVTHDALAVVSYDERAKRYRFRAHDSRGQAIDTELELRDGAMVWSFRPEQAPGTIRFTIKIEGDRWHEIGEFSRDGSAWNRFMEMTLERKKR